MNEVQGAPAWAQGSQTAAANGQKLLRRSQNLIARREIHSTYWWFTTGDIPKQESSNMVSGPKVNQPTCGPFPPTRSRKQLRFLHFQAPFFVLPPALALAALAPFEPGPVASAMGR